MKNSVLRNGNTLLGAKATPLNRRRRLVIEWVLCTLAILVFALLTWSSEMLTRMDYAIYDRFAKLDTQAARQDILIIEIDEASLSALGRWPWPRDLHANLLRQLASANPRAVVFNLPFAEPSANPEEDKQLAKAMKVPGMGPVFLPFGMAHLAGKGSPIAWQLPPAILAGAAAGVGHGNNELDIDGVVRSIRLLDRQGAAPVPSLAWLAYTTLQRAKGQTADWIDVTSPAALRAMTGSTPPTKFLIPFSGPRGRFLAVPYVSVLRGEVPPAALHEKIVIVGMTARGFSDQYATPTTQSMRMMPGVEITASVLEGLLDGRMIKPVNRNAVLAGNFLLLIGWMVLMAWFGHRWALLALCVAATGALLLSVTLLLVGRFWWPPADFLIALVLGHLLWNWRRVTIMLSELNARAAVLKKVANLSLVNHHREVAVSHEDRSWNDIITLMDEAMVQAEIKRMEIIETLHALPEAVLLLDGLCNVKMANRRAHELLQKADLFNINAVQLLGLASGKPPRDPVACKALMQEIESQRANGIEVQVPQGGAYVLLRATTIRSLEYVETTHLSKTWWIVTLVDISERRRLQNQRDQAMQLLWHDLRAPQAAILTLLRMLDTPADLHDEDIVSIKNRITAQVNATLGLADDFVWQILAESERHSFQETDVVQLAHEVMDRAWPIANAKHIKLTCDLSQLESVEQNSIDPTLEQCTELTHSRGPEQGQWVMIEPRLMQRAVFNLVESAIKYSPEGTQVSLTVQIVPNSLNTAYGTRRVHNILQIKVKDQGYGIASKNIARIFDANTRFSSPSGSEQAPAQQGHGLGLLLVKTVAQLHAGKVTCKSTVGFGSEFTLEIPLW
jgi:CHASE2 domain-containing sensor protein/signal transduction histidine kinase